ncbi:hypothetical protein C7N43_33980 [Sphingobacteriales bacterium UPWRP_1]|nr:hypothetical protein C7N43_33980 [Sphingobacteriales bacterium UPWRP_1]
MQYQLIEEYFSSSVFQHTVVDYFDTVLAAMIKNDTLLQAKGLFSVEGKVMRDFYDMPYHIHILNGLLPALHIYEKYLQAKGWIEKAPDDCRLYLKVFMLGFTLHDANKLLHTQQTNHFSDLEIALQQINEAAELLNVKAFFEEFDTYKNDICFLALATEYRTRTLAQQYGFKLSDKHLREVLAELCHLADANGFASVQENEVADIDMLHQAITKSLNKISIISDMPPLPVSYLQIYQNPYTLLSQQLLLCAKNVLRKNGKKILFAMRNGFVFWGNNVTQTEYEQIKQSFLDTKDLKYKELTNIDAQKCTFDFLGTVSLTDEHLLGICTDEKLQHSFLNLSPNGAEKITDFPLFVDFIQQLIKKSSAPIHATVTKDDKLSLKFDQNLQDDDQTFRTLYNLHRIQWFYAKDNKKWKTDFETFTKTDNPLPFILQFGNLQEPTVLKTTQEVADFIASKTKSTDNLYKTVFCCIRTYKALTEQDDETVYINSLLTEIKSHFNKSSELFATNPKQLFADRYLACKGGAEALSLLQNYNPQVNTKKEMCAFTAAPASTPYTEGIAFAMKARGFSNRTVTALKNTTSFIADLFAEENKLRSSNLKAPAKSNLAIYYDFFETSLDLDADVINSCLKAKNYERDMQTGAIVLDKSIKFQYNLYNLLYEEIDTGIENAFFNMRRWIKLVQAFGVRLYITGIMSPYMPHKAVFHWDNAPKFVQNLGWNTVRLHQTTEVIDEINLLLTFGKSRIPSNILAVAHNRNAYFRLYYLLSEKEQGNVGKSLNNFILNYPHKFNFMTVTQQLVELAVKLDLGTKSGSEESWLIRTAANYLRRYVKMGASREDVIQKMSGEIYRTLRLRGVRTDDIEAFTTAVYDKLFLEDWGGKLPTKNIEKDWIYQFAFLFSRRSWEVIRDLSAKKKEQNN